MLLIDLITAFDAFFTAADGEHPEIETVTLTGSDDGFIFADVETIGNKFNVAVCDAGFFYAVDGTVDDWKMGVVEDETAYTIPAVCMDGKPYPPVF